MPDMTFTTILEANPGLIVALGLCIGPPLVLTLIGFLMRREGASLRPIFFIGGMMLPIVIMFTLANLVRARLPPPPAPGVALAVQDGLFVEREKLFGTGIPPQLISDAKSGLPGILDEAEVAEVGMTPEGETVIVAQFATPDQTKRASAAYWRGFRLQNTSGDEDNGWRAKRMQGDYLEMFTTGRQLFVWTGLSKEAASARRAASDLASQFPVLKPLPAPAAFPALQPLGDFLAPAWMKFTGIGMLVLLYSVMFFKGATWAGAAAPEAGVSSVPASELASRLLAISQLDVPFSIAQGEKPNEFIADWRYADAKWIDLARAHGLRRTFRIRLTLDETTHAVRATDYTAEFDWSAGRRGASLSWKAERGIVFFQKEQQRVFGLELDEHGRLKPELSYTWKFDLSEMKSPLIRAITQGGWTWHPMV